MYVRMRVCVYESVHAATNQENVDPAVNGEKDLKKKEKVIASPLTRPRFSAETELLGIISAHYGTKPGHFQTLKIHFPLSEGVSEVSERANE